LVDAESVAEIWAPLLGGVPLYIIPRHVMSKSITLLDKLCDIHISRITITPSSLNSILNALDEMELDEAKKVLYTLKMPMF
jgi:hypothetical protein